MTQKRISVVLASYNGAAWIGAQLASLLENLGPDDEIVVSDDGSSDATLEVLRAICDPRIHLLPPGPRLGYQKNFERAIHVAQGDVIFFSDQDDICLPERIPSSLQALEQADCVGGDARLVDADLKTIKPSHFDDRRARFGAWQMFVRPAVIGATMACRRDFLLASLPFPAEVPHDMWLSIRAARRGRLAIVETPFILYRRHGSAVSLTGTGRKRGLGAIVTERLRLLRALLFGSGPAAGAS